MNIPLNIDWQQILLHLLNFAILAGGLYLLLYKPVKAFMEQRQAYYQGICRAVPGHLHCHGGTQASESQYPEYSAGAGTGHEACAGGSLCAGWTICGTDRVG